ncbi:MAG: bile acid:sodium symporter family protein [Pseudomonadales bacterium]
MVVLAVMVTVGIELRIAQFQAFVTQPRTLILGSLVHTLTFPLIATAMVLLVQSLNLGLSDATVIGMLLIAACPSGGFSNVMALMARVNLPLSVALTTVSSVFSFLTVPLLMIAFGFLIADLDRPVSLPIGQTLVQLLVLVVLPIGVGMVWRARRPAFIDRHLGQMQRVGQIVFYIVITLVLLENAGAVSNGVGEALPWSLLLCLGNVGGCYYGAKIAGLTVEDRVTVALEGSIRNLAVAILIAVNVMDRPDVAVLPTVYFMAVMIVAITFAKTWRRIIKT